MRTVPVHKLFGSPFSLADMFHIVTLFVAQEKQLQTLLMYAYEYSLFILKSYNYRIKRFSETEPI